MPITDSTAASASPSPPLSQDGSSYGSPLLLRKQVRDSVKACKNCPLVDGCQSPVPFYGPSPCKIAVVGEAPGKYEDFQGRPFCGPSGKLARSWLERVGTNPDDVAWLNVVSCYPNRTPTAREVEACRKNLTAQLSVIAPEFILVVGGIASSAWHPNIRIGDLRGRWWTLDESYGHSGEIGALCLATWHPAAVLRNRNLYPQALEDVTMFTMVANGEVGAVLSDRCIMCGGLYDKIENDIGWCLKHWEQKHGRAGKGRPKKPQFRKRTAKDRLLWEEE